MSDELPAIVRAAEHDETAAAERESPSSSTTLGRLVGNVRRRRAVSMALLTVVAVAVVGGAALGLGRLWQADPTAPLPLPITTSSASPDRSATPTPTSTAEPTTTPAASPSPTPSPSPSATPTPRPTTQPSHRPTATPRPSKRPVVPVPGPVTGVKGATGGGSGETMVIWDQGADATGYRVYRSDSLAGPFVRAASIDVTTGKATIAPAFADDYVVIGMYGEVDPGVLYYVDALSMNGVSYYKVAAFNSGGQGPRSDAVCATVPFSTATC